MWFKFRVWLAGLFRRSGSYTVKLSDVKWRKDTDGWYWTAPVYRGNNRCHLTGNYYQLEERLEKPDDSIINIEFGKVILGQEAM